MSGKYQGIPVDEPSISVFFNRVDELVKEKGFHTEIRPDSNNTVLNILCGDNEIAFIDGYSGNVCGHPVEGFWELCGDVEAIRLSIPFENSEEREAARQDRWEAYHDVAKSLMGEDEPDAGMTL